MKREGKQKINTKQKQNTKFYIFELRNDQHLFKIILEP